MRALFIFVLPLLLSGCFGTSSTKDVAKDNTAEDSVVIAGADSDAHGCKASAGYTWSKVLGDCVRLWEVGVALEPTQKDSSSAVLVAYIIFSEDKKSVEFFAPGSNSEILTAQGDIWQSNTTTLKQSDSSYEITTNGNITYKGSIK